MRMTTKLKRKENTDGAVCPSASQRSFVVLMVVDGGILISMISSVKAIAKTPSQKASSLELVLFSVIRVFASDLASGDFAGSIKRTAPSADPTDSDCSIMT